MTDAYIKGFCKTAEEYGVEPVELIKRAYLFARMNNALDRTINGIKSTVNDFRQGGFTGGMQRTGQRFVNLLKRDYNRFQQQGGWSGGVSRLGKTVMAPWRDPNSWSARSTFQRGKQQLASGARAAGRYAQSGWGAMQGAASRYGARAGQAFSQRFMQPAAPQGGMMRPARQMQPVPQNSVASY